ncbi:glycosyltransferase family A protein [Paenibacillus sp. FSL H7-0756]|uniref:glycosyltransferase family A protein n=1 Tax=Paenibacillus sp. FSL H7-0756 TaxID=2954738 RepID=UPI0030F4B86B
MNLIKPPAVLLQTLAFNVEEYIVECVESVLNQSFIDFEWIVVDNGSTDRTSMLLEEYAKRDSRIRLFRNEKNTFLYNEPWNPDYIEYLNSSKAEYWCALDSDDYIHSDFLKELYAAAIKYNADIVVAGTTMFLEENPHKRSVRCPPDFYTEDLTTLGDLLPQIYSSFRSMWGKLFKLPLAMKQSNYRTVEKPLTLLNAFDTLFCLDCLSFAHSVVGINKPLHYYRMRQNSFYNSQLNKNRYLDYKTIFEESKELLRSWNKLNDSNLQFIASVFLESIKDCVKIAMNAKSASIEDRLEAIEMIISDEFVYQVLRQNDLWDNLFIKVKDIVDQKVGDIEEFEIPLAMNHFIYRLYSSIKMITSAGDNKQDALLLYLSSICDINNKNHFGVSLLYPFFKSTGKDSLAESESNGIPCEFLASQPDLLREIVNGDSEKALIICDQNLTDNNFILLKQSLTKLGSKIQLDELTQVKLNMERSIYDEKYEEAVELLLDVLETHPLDYDALYYKLYILILMGELLPALETAIVLKVFYPYECNSMELIALAFLNVGLKDMARSLYQTALDLCVDETQRQHIKTELNAL